MSSPSAKRPADPHKNIHSSGKSITAEEAAGTIFRVARPNEKQIQQIQLLIAKRILKPCDLDPRKTTAGEVARYLAAKDVQQGRGAAGSVDSQSMLRVYHGFALDYFLAVTLQRKSSARSQSFERAVLAGQIMSLVGIAALVVFSLFSVANRIQPHHKMVTQYLATKHARFDLQEIAPAKVPPPGTLRVRYRYFSDQGKGIETVRFLQVEQGRVVGESSAAD